MSSPFDGDAWEGDSGLAAANDAYSFDSPESLPGFGLNVGVAGAIVRPADEIGPSPGTILNGVELDGFSADMAHEDSSGLTNANNGFAANMLANMKAATDEAFSQTGSEYSGEPQGSFGQPDQPGATPGSPAFPGGIDVSDPRIADALHTALENGLDSSVFAWAAQTPADSVPSVNPDDEIWSSPLGGILSHQAVQAEQAGALLQGGQNWLDRAMRGDVFDSAWSTPGGGILSHQGVLNEQAQALAQGGQSWINRAMVGDIFDGYRDSTTGEIVYSEQDAWEVTAQMAMRNADATRYGAIGDFFYTPHQPGTGFELDTDIPGVWSDIPGVQSRADTTGRSRMQRLMDRVI